MSLVTASMHALRVTPPKRVRLDLELVGLDVMMNSERLPSGSHVLLMPVGMQRGEYQNGVWAPDGERLRWDRIETRTESAEATAQCIWDFIGLVDGAVDDFVGFVSKWGLLDFGEDLDGFEGYMGKRQLFDFGERLDSRLTDQAGSSHFAKWRRVAHEARSALRIIAVTEAGELVGEDVLEILDYWDDFQRTLWSTARRQERWRAERKAGRGLALQKRFIVNFFNGFVGKLGPSEEQEYGLHRPWTFPLEPVVLWDDEGRRLESVAYGVRQVVGAHLLSIFTTPGVDVFICSVCGNPYPFEPSECQRRPRKGRRRFCGEACVTTARRASNRASWHRNKAGYRKRAK